MDTDEAQELMCIHGRRIFLQPNGKKYKYYLASYASKTDLFTFSWEPCYKFLKADKKSFHDCWFIFEAVYLDIQNCIRYDIMDLYAYEVLTL